MADDDDTDKALERLEELQAKLYRVRFDLPVLLRGLAHIDETETVNNIFTKTVEDARSLSSDLDDFLKLHAECSQYLAVSDLEKSVSKPPDMATVDLTTTSQSTVATPVNTAARNDALAAQRSIQNLIGGGSGGLGSLEEPILLDDPSLSFAKF